MKSMLPMNPALNILAVSGSLRKGSSTTLLLQALQHLAPENLQLEIWENLDTLPHFNPDLDREGEMNVQAVQDWREKVQKADGVLICTPEYAAGLPGSFKNALDWLVGSGDMADKPVAAVAASPYPTSAEHAHTSLMLTLGMLEARVPAENQLKIGLLSKKLNAQAEITDPELNTELQRVLSALQQTILQAQPV
ncbi:NADPH-dependent FMN reductase [Deinococcus roseus]|nr:NAD(P)H-dependent oxidoreductase [Deinococcus roseus]